MKTKPFDLEAAKKGAPVVTRDGRPVRLFAFDFDNPGVGTIAGALKEDGREWLRAWHPCGKYVLGMDGELDLFMPTKTREGFIIVLDYGRSDCARPCSDIYGSKEAAEHAYRTEIRGSRAQIVPVTYEE